MKIVFVSPEVYPFAKTGGLADVSYSFPDALVRKGHDVSVIMPAYRQIDKKKYHMQLLYPALPVPFGPEVKYAAVYSSAGITSFKTYFIEYNPFFGRDGYYGDIYGDFQDNPDRFAFFSVSTIELLKKMDSRPDIIHCNEWQTGPLPFFLKNMYQGDPDFAHTATVMTVHNAGYQGIFNDRKFLSMINNKKFDINDIIACGKINFLKAGLTSADMITTVSRRYSEELQKAEFGYGLADVFRKRSGNLYGILNGIDDSQWDPASDPLLPENYSAADLAGKKACKRELQSRIGLPVDENIPAAGIVSRLTDQKGLDVLADALEYILQDEAFQFVAAGTGDEWIYRKYERLRKMFPGKVGLFYGYDEELAHIIHAGLDIFVMPSRYEPCGLSVMYSLKYGTVPAVRATGGLDEIIIDWDADSKNGNGFKFNNLTVEEIYSNVRRAVRYHNDKRVWKIIRKNAMKFSRTWDKAIPEYEKVYKTALKYQKYLKKT